VLISSGARWALMHELRAGPELSLFDALARLSPCDIVLVEGYKRAPIPKLEVWRAVLGKPLLNPHDPHIVAVAADPVGGAGGALPELPLSDAAAVATFIAGAAAAWRSGD